MCRVNLWCALLQVKKIILSQNIYIIYYAGGLAIYVGAYLRGDDYDRAFKPNGPIRNVLRQEEYYKNTLAPRHVFKDYKSSEIKNAYNSYKLLNNKDLTIPLEVSASTNFDWYMYAYCFEGGGITPQLLQKMDTLEREIVKFKQDFHGKVSHLHECFSYLFKVKCY